MKLVLAILLFSSMLSAAPGAETPYIKSNIINVDNEIEILQETKASNKRVFKVLKVKPNSTFKDMGYKAGDLVKKIDNETIMNKNQLKAALDRQATEWENTAFDNDFSEGEMDFNEKSFDELEKELEQ